MKGTCDACGRCCDKLIGYFGKHLCTKHYNQYKKYGKFLDSNPRTIYDKNEYHIDGDITYIDLYDKDCNVIAQAIIDTEDLDKVKDIKWKLSWNGYAMNTPKGSIAERGPNKHMSRVIYGEDRLTPELFVDHINHNTLDNRKKNLRAATKSENAMNSIKMRNPNSTNPAIGVYETTSGLYNAYIKYHQMTYNLGVYAYLEEAMFARYIAEYLLFGEYQYKKECPVIDPDSARIIIRKVINIILDYTERNIQDLYIE